MRSLKSILKAFGMGACMGCIIFIYVYGTRVLNVQNDAWLLVGGDLTQQYLGWCFFRNSEWMFPWGLTNLMTYPHPISIMYSDSIPAFALLFKLLSPILPSTFQYHGIWGLLCFLLQGGLAAVLLHKYIYNQYVCGLFSLFFICTSVFFQRMFVHTAMASHWIILLAFCLLVYSEQLMKKGKTIIFIWSGVAVISVCVHAYFVPITFLILLCYLYTMWWSDSSKLLAVYTIVGYFLGLIFGLYLLGGLQSGFDTMEGVGLGHFSSNLNSLFNSRTHYSRLLPGMPINAGQYEGDAYLGAGALVLLIFALAFVSGAFYKGKDNLIFTRQNQRFYISIVLLMGIFLFLAVAPKITCGHYVVLEFSYPVLINKLLSMFRATGRFMFPVLYMIVLFSIVAVVKTAHKRVAYTLIGICLIFQLYDFSGLMQERHRYYKYFNPDAVLIKQEVRFDNIIKNYNRVVFLNSRQVWEQQYEAMLVDYYAQRHVIPVSAFYLARMPKWLSQTDAEYTQKLRTGDIAEDELFIFLKQEDIKKEYQVKIYQFGKFFIGSKKDVEGLQLYKPFLS